jgi:hypothetical protein
VQPGRIAILNRRGVVTPLDGLPDDWNFSNPTLSPDGNTIAFMGVPPRSPGVPRADGPVTPTAIVIYKLPSGPATFLDNVRDVLPSWLPGSQEVAFTRTSPVRATIMIQKADGSEPARELLAKPLLMTSTTWFPDGRRFIVAHNGTLNERDGRLAIVSLDQPDTLVTILQDRMWHSHPALSPDGSMLAFVTAEPNLTARGNVTRGWTRITVHRFSDGAAAQIDDMGATHPNWSRDGERLFFQANDGTLQSVAVRNGARLSLQAPRQATPYRFAGSTSRFAVLPGDTLFVVRMNPAPVIAAPIPANLRGRRANIRDQRSLEIAAAREIVEIARSQGLGFETHALDIRAYSLASEPPFAGFVDTTQSHLLPSHIEQHVAETARILGVAGRVNDENNCSWTRPGACRMQGYPGLVAFSPAIVSGDSARISVVRSTRGVGLVTGASETATYITWRLTFVRSGMTWTLRSVGRIG